MKAELLIVERIEDGIVTIERSENEVFEIKLSEVDGDVHEGDVLKHKNGKYYIDKEKTEELRKISVYLQNSAFGIRETDND